MTFLAAQSTSYYMDLIKTTWKLSQFSCLTQWWFHILSEMISLQILCQLSFTGVHLIQESVTYGLTGSPVPAFLRDTKATAS